MSPATRPPLRVEIAPVGYYLDRVYQPVIEHDADRVYLIRERERGRDTARRFRTEVTKKLLDWKRSIDIRVIPTDMWDLESAVETFSALVKREIQDGNSVWVNLSTGSKLEAVAAAIACMAHGGTPYYVHMGSYEKPGPAKPLAEGVTSVEVVPVYGLSSPTSAQLSVLSLLGENPEGLSKKSLLSGLDESNLMLRVSTGGGELSTQARYGRLQAMLDGLLSPPPLVEIHGSRKSGRIHITARGVLAIRIFSPREPRIDEPGHPRDPPVPGIRGATIA